MAWVYPLDHGNYRRHLFFPALSLKSKNEAPHIMAALFDGVNVNHSCRVDCWVHREFAASLGGVGLF